MGEVQTVLGIDHASGADITVLVEQRGDRIIAVETDPERIERRLAWHQLRARLRDHPVVLMESLRPKLRETVQPRDHSAIALIGLTDPARAKRLATGDSNG